MNRINQTHTLWVSNISGKTSHIHIVATSDYPPTDNTSHAICTYVYDRSTYWTEYAYLLFLLATSNKSKTKDTFQNEIFFDNNSSFQHILP